MQSPPPAGSPRSSSPPVLGKSMAKDQTKPAREVDPARASGKERDRFLAIASRMAHLGAWTVLLDDGLVRLSDEACAIHELRAGSALTVREGVDLYAAESRTLIEAAFAACVGDGTPYDVEATIHTATGRLVPVRVSGEAVRGSRGRIERIEGVVQDVSSLREAQVHAHGLDARLARTLDSVTDAFYTLDRDWRFTFANREAERILERTRAQMLGQCVWDAFPEAVGTSFEVEYRRAMETGEAAVFESFYAPLDLWVAVRAYPSDDGLAVYFLDINDKRAAEQALLSSEQRYRSLFERSGDAVLVADDTGRFVDANPAACVLLGVTRDVAIGRSLMDFVDPSDDLPDAEAGWASFLAAGEMRGDVRIRRPDGTIRDAEFLATANVTPGRHLSVLRDDSERLAAQAGLVEAVAALTSSEDRFRSTLDNVALPALILDATGTLLFVNRHMRARTGWTEEELVGSNVFSWLAADQAETVTPEAYESGMASPDAFARQVESTWRTKSGDRLLIAWTNSAITDDSGRTVAVAAIGEDVTARREAETAQARLTAAIGQATDSIMVTDLKGRVVYANPAFEQMSGVPVAEVMGKEPRAVLGACDSAKAYPRIGRRLLSGQPWSGEWDLTRRDGTSYREEVTISPVRAQSGEIVNFVRVARDVTRLNEVQASLASTMRGREEFVRALARLQQRESPEETARDITDAVVELTGVDLAALVTFEPDGGARVLAMTTPDGHDPLVGATIPPAAAAYLIERTSQGSWAVGSLADAFVEHAQVWASLMVKGVAFAPIGIKSGLIGLVAVGTRDAKVAARIEDQLPVAVEFAAAARSLIAGPLALRAELQTNRRRIECIISDGAFEPVFQPIVRMSTGEPIGFEALTRFDDGTRPDLVFAEATAAGVGLDLEAATMSKAMAAALSLPSDAWLSLNVSAALILDPDRLTPIINRRTRPVVIEVTEHDSITEYGSVRAAVALLGPDVRLAVDDAGAGVANFSHIVSLRPDFVKIDLGLVRGVNHDLTRQALIVGLRHFASATNGWLIAEGVETEEECRTLLGLDLEYGQGYLFGRPATASTWARPAS
jgi:PAS domain S-box-containing protein